MKLCPNCQRCYEDADAVCSFDDAALLPSRHGSCIIAEKYRLDRLLGRGGMGAVYAGTHVDLERPVAIKLLLPDFIADTDALERFRREARAAARLNHPNVADTYDYGALPEGGAYIVMELVEGQTLRQRMDAVGPLPFRQAITIARQVASGVEAAHRSGIIHRDLKPSNIILTLDHDGHMLAKVVDFSVAKLKEGTTSGAALTATGSLIGTPRYMAPEQCADNKTDARSDIYSLGVILYEMLAGRAPFEGPTTTAIAIKHIQEPPPPLSNFRPDAPQTLIELVTQSLAKQPSQRPQTAQEFAARLVEALADLPAQEDETIATAPNLIEASKQPFTDARRLETNPQGRETSTDTERSGEPTREDSIVPDVDAQEQLNANNPPSVQSYGVMLGEEDEELETQISSKNTHEPNNEKEILSETIASEERKELSDFPLLSKHSKPLGHEQSSEAPPASTEAPVEASESRPGRSFLPYAVAAALLVILGLGIFFASYRRKAQPGSGNNSSTNSGTASTINKNESAGAPSDNAYSKSGDNQPALSDAGSANVPKGDERAELQSLRDQWVNATVARDVNKILSFYPPVMDAFYRKRNVPVSAVREDKERMLTEASLIELEVGEPTINFSKDGRKATMTFRKRWNFKGAQNSTGEVLQELQWVKTNQGWKISSERDLSIIR